MAWIVLGLIAGFPASKIVNRRGEGVVLDIVIGFVGAFVALLLGAIFSGIGGAWGTQPRITVVASERIAS